MINVKTSRPYDFFTFTVNFTGAQAPYYTFGKVLKNTFSTTPNITLDNNLLINAAAITLNNYTDFYGPYDVVEIETSILQNSFANNTEVVTSSSSLNLANPTQLLLSLYKPAGGTFLNDYTIKITLKKYLITPTYASYVQTTYAGATVNPLNWSNLVF